MANLQLIQPLGNDLARDQNSRNVNVPAVVAFETKHLDNQSVEFCHVETLRNLMVSEAAWAAAPICG